MTAKKIRLWAAIHKWSSLVCTLFMLLLCLTGLPLIFHHEIGELLGTEVEAPTMAANAPRASLDQVLQVAKTRHPGKDGMFISRDADDDRIWFVTLSDTPTSDTNLKQVALDARTSLPLAEPKLNEGIMHIILKLHVDLFAGLPGMLFLGFMGLLLFLAIVSGVVLYAPFMRKLAFGTVRHESATRTKWLDMHNMLGIVVLVWASVVALTGTINTLADPIIDLWRTTEVAAMVAPYKGLRAPPAAERGSLQAAVDAARALAPEMAVGFIAFPGTTFSSPHHYGVFLRGNTPVTKQLYKPVLVDARTSKVTDSRVLPWYVATLLLSQPLHFGDYGGRPMQILWALLDLATMVVLGSGVYLWLRRGSRGAPATTNTPTPAQLRQIITEAG